MFESERQRFGEFRLRLIDRFHRFCLRSAYPIRIVEKSMMIISFLAASAFLTIFIIYFGYDHSAADYVLIKRCVRAVQAVFIANVLFNILFRGGLIFHGAKFLSRIINPLILITLALWITPRSVLDWLPIIDDFLYSRYFLSGILLLYSVTLISYTLTLIMGRRTNPSLILSGSFLAFIILGTFLLMLPKCSYGTPINFSDALFLSTSAVCITGLTPIDIAAVLTPTGIIVLAILVQAGALGVITFTSFFALFFTGSSSIYSQLLLRDVIYSKSMSNLIPTLLYILLFTLCVEAVGALLIFFAIHNTLGMTVGEEIAFAAFHSLSGFCNAGFSTLPGGLSNPLLLYGHQSFYWVMSFIIVAGAIGFPILVNIKDAAAGYFRRFKALITGRSDRDNKPVHIFSMNTKIVLVTFFILFIIGTLAFWILEHNNSLRSFSPGGQITQAVFNSVTPRSAGFSSVDPTRFLNPTLLIIMFLMWIGGGSQSTAGGIKVNTFAAILLNLRSSISGRERITAFNRTIAPESVRRANAVVAISIISFLVYCFIILILEPHLSVKALIFETLSALFTVGSSLGITPLLSSTSKVLLASAMFLGRVGIISLMSGFVARHSGVDIRYPSDNLIIN